MSGREKDGSWNGSVVGDRRRRVKTDCMGLRLYICKIALNGRTALTQGQL